jgi:hypothetical protein
MFYSAPVMRRSTYARRVPPAAAKYGGSITGWRGWLTLLGLAMLLAAVLRELRLPREQRTWHGMLMGVVPYDLRPPTMDRFVRTFWNPEQEAVLGPTAFGVGWGVNAAALVRLLGAPER